MTQGMRRWYDACPHFRGWPEPAAVPADRGASRPTPGRRLDKPGQPTNDHLIYSKGHASPPVTPAWTRDHVASVQITMAEEFGVEGRGAFYETTGCLRDVIENHLFLVVALLAMEPPAVMSADLPPQREGQGLPLRATLDG